MQEDVTRDGAEIIINVDVDLGDFFETTTKAAMITERNSNAAAIMVQRTRARRCPIILNLFGTRGLPIPSP